MGGKKKFPFYLSPEKKAILERRYQEDGSQSLTAFIEKAVDFYLDYLSANDAGLFLPTSIKSYLDGRLGQLEERLGQLEERLSSIAFRQTVEQDMVAGILADAYQFSDEDLRRRRSESVQNVRKTNGRISLDQRVRGPGWRRTMSGRIDCEKPLSQVWRRQFGQRLSAVYWYTGTGGIAPG